MGIRIAIPPQQPPQIPRLITGMPALPFSFNEPFTAIKQRPEGGIPRDTSVSGLGNGSINVAATKEGAKRHRRSSKPSNGNGITIRKEKGLRKTKTDKKTKRNNRPMVRGPGGKFKKGG